MNKMEGYKMKQLDLQQVAHSSVSVSTSAGQVKDSIPRDGKQTETSTEQTRLEKARKKYRNKRMNETEEARRIRLEKRRRRYDNETEEQRAARLHDLRIRKMEARARETEEEVKVRQEKDRIRQSRSRAVETFEEKRIRLERRRIRFHRLKALRDNLIVQRLDFDEQ